MERETMSRVIPEVRPVFDARLYGIADGDTFRLRLRKYHGDEKIVRGRLLGIDCPETRGPERVLGLEAKRFAAGWFAEAHGVDLLEHWPFIEQRDPAWEWLFVPWRDDPEYWPLTALVLDKTDKYGRQIARAWRKDTGENLEAALEASRHGVEVPELVHLQRLGAL